MRHRRIRARRAAPTGTPRSASAISTWATRLCRARSSSVGSEPMLWVPNTTSTHGARFSTASRSFCARQPPTAICMSGLACLRGTRWLMLPYSLLSAFSRTAQVLNTTTSASAPSAARSVSGRLEQPGEPLGVVHVHLAAVGADLIGALADDADERRRRSRRRPSPRASPSKSRPNGTAVTAHAEFERIREPGELGVPWVGSAAHGDRRVGCDRDERTDSAAPCR